MKPILFFCVYYILCYFSGRGIIYFLPICSKIELKKIEIKIFFPLLSLFFLGNLNIIFNFFFPINRYLIFIYFLITISLNIFFLDINKFKEIKLQNFLYTLPIFYLPISSYGIGLSYDAGLYHLNFQKWISSNKIVFGLANLHMRYGYASIFDYINTNFWFNNNYLLLHFTNLIFIVVFYQFILFLLYSKSEKINAIAISIILFGILDNFGLNGGKNGFIEIEGVTKYDSVFGIMFCLFIIKFLIIQDSKFKIDKSEQFLILVLLIFSIELRPLGFLLIFPFMILYINKKINLKYRFNIVFFFILFFSMIKNLIISGCLIFPIESTCIQSLEWYEFGYASMETSNIQSSLRSYEIGENIFDWYSYWSNKNIYNKSSLFNFLYSTLFIFFVISIIFKLNKLKKYLIIYLSIFSFSIYLWFITTPDPRFGIGLFMSLISLIAIMFDKIRLNIKVVKYIGTFLFIFSLIFIIRIDSLKSFIASPLKNITISIPTDVNYINENGRVFRDNKSEQCWINILCVPSYSQNVYFKTTNLGYDLVMLTD